MEAIDNAHIDTLLNLEKYYKDRFKLLIANLQPILYTIKSSQKLRSWVKSTTHLSNTLQFIKTIFSKKTFINNKLKMLSNFNMQPILVVFNIFYRN